MNNLQKYLSAKFFKEAMMYYISKGKFKDEVIEKKRNVLNKQGQKLYDNLQLENTHFMKDYQNKYPSRFHHQPYLDSHKEFKDSIFEIVLNLINTLSYDEIRDLYCGNLFNLKKYELFDLSEFRKNDRLVVNNEFRNEVSEDFDQYLKSKNMLNSKEIKEKYSEEQTYYSMKRGQSIESEKYNQIESEMLTKFLKE